MPEAYTQLELEYQYYIPRDPYVQEVLSFPNLLEIMENFKKQDSKSRTLMWLASDGKVVEETYWGPDLDDDEIDIIRLKRSLWHFQQCHNLKRMLNAQEACTLLGIKYNTSELAAISGVNSEDVPGATFSTKDILAFWLCPGKPYGYWPSQAAFDPQPFQVSLD